MARTGSDVQVFRPYYRDKKTGERKQQAKYVYTFTVHGVKLPNTPTGTEKKTLAYATARDHKKRLEQAALGIPSADTGVASRMRTVAACIDAYIKGYAVNHADKSAAWVRERAPHIKRILGSLMLADIDKPRLLAYMETRLAEGVGPRTINMELDTLARSIGHAWSVLWPKLKRLEEPRDTGRALEPEEQTLLLEWSAKSVSPYMLTMLRIGLLTGMRIGEISKLRWHQVDLSAGTISIGRANSRRSQAARVKTPAGVRKVPMPTDLYAIFAGHAAFIAGKLGPVAPEWYVFPKCNRRRPSDPHIAVTGIKSAWGTVRERAGVECRFHDMRHTAYTKLIEAGVPEGVIEGLMGHISKAMKDRYSHVRMAAMRTAVQHLTLTGLEPPLRPLAMVSARVSPKPTVQ